MLDGALNGAVPLEAQIAVARRNRNLRDGVPDRAGTVDVQLLGAKPVCLRAVAAVDEFGAEHVPIERIGHRAVRYMDHAVIELGQQAGHPEDVKRRGGRRARSASGPAPNYRTGST
jgi:hypothetical protein